VMTHDRANLTCSHRAGWNRLADPKDERSQAVRCPPTDPLRSEAILAAVVPRVPEPLCQNVLAVSETSRVGKHFVLTVRASRRRRGGPQGIAPGRVHGFELGASSATRTTGGKKIVRAAAPSAAAPKRKAILARRDEVAQETSTALQMPGTTESAQAGPPGVRPAHWLGVRSYSNQRR